MSDEQTETVRESASALETKQPMLGRYRVEDKLGEGGMGVVFAAFDLELHRRVALKVIREGMSEQANQRLLREARAMARLQHPNVVTIYDVTSANGRDYISMELVDGEPLNEWLRTTRSEAEVLDAFLQAGRGLAAAHGKGIVHRDFKPHNVLRSKDGRVAVTDFGLAREASNPLAITQSNPPPDALSALTIPGGRVGTPAYMAPEQWSGGRVSFATDQFAYSVALWEAFAGERPFRGDTVDALRAEIDRGARALDASKLPRRLRSILIRGLERDPEKRWPSMAAMMAKLAPRKRWPIVVAGLALIALGAVVVLLARGGDRTEEWQALQAEARTARDDGRLDEAIGRSREALELRDDEGLRLELAKLLLSRKRDGDLEAARRMLVGSTQPEAEWLDATAAWFQGEPTARARLLRFHKAELQGRLKWQGDLVGGTVVMPDGTPASGATVVAGSFVTGDSLGIVTPLWDPTGISAQVWVTEAYSGKFYFRLTPGPTGVLVAELGNLRSRGNPIVNGQRLKLEPTSQVRGRVDRGGRTESVSAFARAQDSQVLIVTPVGSDGRFVLDGLVSGPTTIGVLYGDGENSFSGFTVQQEIDAGSQRSELVFELPATRVLTVIVRGVPARETSLASKLGLPAVFANVGSGRYDLTGQSALVTHHQAQLAANVSGRRPQELGSQLQPEDEVVRFRRAPIGEATVCIQITARQLADNLVTTCKPVAANAEVVVVDL